MNSLVGYGVSSDSDSDGDADDINNGGTGSSEEVRTEAPGVQRSRNFLLEPDSASSDSASDSEAEDEASHPMTPSASRALSSPASLPAPNLGSSKLPPPSLSASSDSSVFTNPFKAQADQRLNVLQKHVPLTMQARPSQIGGKRMCVSYRKDGRCRFGIKCKFAHDSDLQTPGTPAYCQPPEEEEETPASERDDAGGSQESQKETKEEESGGQPAKKRKVGLSNSLIPPKRAMKQYAMLQDRERLHMS